jgi:trimethylamine:corrinoid methyltransferase-like protein
MKFLTLLLGVLDKLLGAWAERRWKQQGRQEAIKDANDEINRQIELGEAAVTVPDPERDERLRDRFDRSRK